MMKGLFLSADCIMSKMTKVCNVNFFFFVMLMTYTWLHPLWPARKFPFPHTSATKITKVNNNQGFAGSEIALSWSPIRLKKFALATKISQLVASGRLTMLFHATIITQTVALIFSQIDQYKIQSRLPIGHFHFTVLLLWKYKTVFLLL